MTDSQSAQPPPLSAAARDRRTQLLDIARELMVREGYAGTSVSAIVRAAGVAQGTFYLYFPTKQAVLAELRREVFRDYVQAFEAAARGPGPADARLVRVALALFAAVDRTRDLVRVFHQAATGEETEQAVLGGRDRLAGQVAALLAEGHEAGRLFCPDPQLSAHLVLALFDNLFYEALEYGRPAPGLTVLRGGMCFTLRALRVDENRIEELAALIEESP